MSADLDRVLKAFAHPARRTILRVCWTRRRAAGDLASRIDLAPATVSEHIRTLRDAGLLDESRSGTWRFYRTNHVTLKKELAGLRSMFPNDV